MKYTLLFKTGDAEMRALRNIQSEIYSHQEMSLLIELTRGRKSKKDRVGDLSKRVTALSSFLPDDVVVYFDITSDPNLSNEQIDSIFSSDDGYKNWQCFFAELRSVFKNAIPMLLINDTDSAYHDFRKQIRSFADTYRCIGYKIEPSVDKEIIKKELDIIAEELQHTGNTNVTVFYDQGYIVDGLVKIAVDRAISYLELAHDRLKDFENIKFVLTSTSFPDSVVSLNKKTNQVTIACTEQVLFNRVKENLSFPISYSDYGSITPKRNDVAAYYGNGWIPRIDVPKHDVSEIFYYRQKKNKESDEEYADVYIEVAKACMGDARFPKGLTCWGCQTVENTANGMKPGSTPSFWISVRMNMFVTQQMKRLGLL